ncbi:peptidase S8 S53 subtilisin kexin sedolisin family protein [Nitzschia inconspicua]|uniref:Peptidase S8 S53 subtilisin kexin sedolisin family protein n=1 Tax=Nitzschia inconspicua TaxID=303405 RepID=A0A9K3LIG0_9STRA|nr:peptidase S8 S53 subtilisin kexin sedolisin family protein [Nitzschia inconspicua]
MAISIFLVLLVVADASTLRGAINAARNKATSLNPTRRYVARYSNMMGRRSVRRCAKRILMDANNTDYTIFEGDRWCFSMLWNDASIEDIEEDFAVSTLGGNEELPSSEQDQSLKEYIPWGIKAIQADLLSTGPHDVTVCLVDSGIASGHPDFLFERISGTDRAEDGLRWDRDRGGHGTHIAGIISAASNNNMGVRGVGVFNLFVARALDDNNQGSESFMWRAVEECIEAGVDVINLSLGGLSMTTKAAEVYSRAANDYGIILVAAAGNSGDNKTFYPANYPPVIAVGASDERGERINSSVNTPQLELQGPGYSVLSTGIASSALHTPDFSYPAKQVDGTPNEAVTGKLVYYTFDQPFEAQGEDIICLFDTADRGNENLTYEGALVHCSKGGGKGAVFFDSRRISGIQVLELPESKIPVLSIRADSGNDLRQRLENNGSMNVTMSNTGNEDELEFTYTWGTGSSVAAAHVAAGAALLKSHFYSCTSHQIRYALAYTAKRLSTSMQCDEYYGYGVIQVKDAYDWLLAQGGCDSWAIATISKGGCTTIGEGVIHFNR